jgi:hypothetical protein
MSIVPQEAQRLYQSHLETAEAIHVAALGVYRAEDPTASVVNVTLNGLISSIQQINSRAFKHFQANEEQYVDDALSEAEAAGVSINMS